MYCERDVTNLRLHPPAPLLIPRNVEKQVKLYDNNIRKGTRVLVNAWAIGQDPTIWEYSKEFKPEIFLICQIDVRVQDFELIPFGSRRRCWFSSVLNIMENMKTYTCHRRQQWRIQ
ncbi:putative geraniol 8-hydroxylase [Helianthus annuus]|nr:putative geraniol 8-hydroxylase [Helianthus annuus]